MRRSLLIFLLLTGCSLAPKYEVPAMDIPLAYKSAGKWSHASPHWAMQNKGAWWQVYHDAILNKLEAKVPNANQSIAASLARFQQARQLGMIASADYFPKLTGLSDAKQLQSSSNVSNVFSHTHYNDLSLGMDLSYELDVWGRIGNQAAEAKDKAQASAADLATLTLALQAQLAENYFSLRAEDGRTEALNQAVQAYAKAYGLTQRRYQGGVAAVADVEGAKAQLETAKTLAADSRLKRAQLSNAIAVLIGVPPANFTLSNTPYHDVHINIGAGVPSALLQRRPDIARAQWLVQAANAHIGVARAAFFPDFSLVGNIGLESAMGATLFQAPSLFWSLGPSASMLLFNGGKVSSFEQLARDQYVETVANYRQITLTAMQEVEDQLVAIEQLKREVQTQHRARVAAEKALAQNQYRYLGGLITYLDVVVVQNIALQAQLNEIEIQARGEVASVQLIKALGGGWS